MVRIKFCGLTDKHSAKTAVEAGADAIGFVFAASKREVTPEQAKEIIESLPPYVSTVGVFVDETLDRINEIAEYCQLDMLQLHGSETPEYCHHIKRPAVKAIKVRKASDLDQAAAYKQVVRGLLLDAYVEGASGGTGHTFPWEYAAKARGMDPIVLAGGLRADNVEEAIIKISPFAVDVSSGIESDGVKDPRKMIEFVQRVRNVSIFAQS
ncbi:phosphoribosylanthranilate isomerase [Siminovitchia terrae]|uniref:phosphoribosylanthranilate isomerase n=1 Tax=Siminovitchia terrae TaxID=1914933 RepID=UPI001B0E5525|nr:phosphoribosylanthranilate isomerase [Siminovitchia terrae]GIN92708.1 N-(5'-phosphoribosyl)anthranilate isomerase [Siminovitchia terrae]